MQPLDKGLRGIKAWRDNSKVTAAAYADDVKVFLSTTEDAGKIQQILSTYEEVAGAKFNTQKSRELALGNSDDATKILDIPYSKEIKILGFKFTNRENIAARESWSNVKTGAVSRTGGLIQGNEFGD